MKTTIALLLASLTTATSYAETSLPDHWVREDKKRVYYVPIPDLKITLSHIGAEEYWSALGIELGFLEQGNGSQELALKYPGYEVVRAVIEKETDFILEVPGLVSSERLEANSSIEGPYIRWSQFLTQVETWRVRELLKTRPQSIQIKARLRAFSPVLTTVDSAGLPATVCREVASQSSSVFDVMANLAKLNSRIESIPVKHASTRKKLQRSILESCVDLDSHSSATSFREFLELPARIRQNPVAPSVEVAQEKVEARSVELKSNPKVTYQEAK